MTEDRDKLAQDQALRRDTMSFIDYVGFGKGLPLTQVSKNLTLKDVRAINALFVEPEALDEQIGERVYKLRNEEEAPAFTLSVAYARLPAWLKSGMVGFPRPRGQQYF